MALTSGLLRIAAVMTGIARLGSAAHSGGEFDLDDVGAGFLERPHGRDLADRAIALIEGTEHDHRVTLRQIRVPERTHPQGGALRLELRPDVAAPERRHDLRDRHVLVHHLDAILRGLLGQRHYRGIARMAHHRDAGRLGGHGFAKLLHHLLHRPTGEDVVDVRSDIGLGLLGAIVDDGAEGVALRPADEETQVHVLAPIVAQSLRVSRRRECEHRGRGQNSGSQILGSHVNPPWLYLSC